MMDPIPDLVPAPASHAHRPDRTGVVLDASTVLAAAPGTGTAERWLRTTLGAAFGLPLPPAPDGTAPDGTAPDGTAPLGTGPGGAHAGGTGRGTGPGGVVALRLDPDLGPEAYRLTAADGAVDIAGGDAAGVFWGAQTLRQLLGPDAFRRAPVRPGTAPGLAATRIEDRPRFAWRGLLLDVARHFLPKDDVLRQLDLLAAHKLNVLHLHLTDDQGWRVEIRRHPRLTEVGAWRPRTKRGHRASPLWDDTPHGGFYTQDDLREIVAYAADRHVRVVPEIDLPGHSQAAIAAYPHLGNTDVVDTAALGVRDTWGISPHVLAPTEETLRFYEGVLEEVLDIFPATTSPFVHIGGDECPKGQWRASATAQARIRELGVGDEDGLQAWFVRHFDRWLADRGRRLIGWDEILEGGPVRPPPATAPPGAPPAVLPSPGTAVSSWRGYAGGVAAARAGHDVVMCPEQHVYLDHRQDGGPDEPVPIGYVRTLEDVYRFDPLPPGLPADAAAHVLGAQANVWTEVLDSRSRVDYQTFPRLAAFAEAVWSTGLPAPADRDFPDFARRMATHYRRLDALGVAYRPPGGPAPWQRRPGVLGRPIEGPPPNV
ncbi:beta-N-acetylhexosaminidase [Streptomyces kanasensis]|uniref:beta-N-acetylhexosaminidase n=1 Tax=Streptomyces kanasensis TaxID=936756 RepID=UPI0036FF4531